jgi:hypothetical protein
MTELSVVRQQTADSLKQLWQNYRLSKQAKAFLSYLLENNIDGSTFSKKNEKKTISEIFAETHSNIYPEVGFKLIDGVWTYFYLKGITLKDYVNINKDKIPNVRFIHCSLCGELHLQNHSLENSLRRTIQRLWKWRLIERFYQGSMFGARHYYFITEKGKRVFQLKHEGEG